MPCWLPSRGQVEGSGQLSKFLESRQSVRSYNSTLVAPSLRFISLGTDHRRAPSIWSRDDGETIVRFSDRPARTDRIQKRRSRERRASPRYLEAFYSALVAKGQGFAGHFPRSIISSRSEQASRLTIDVRYEKKKRKKIKRLVSRNKVSIISVTDYATLPRLPLSPSSPLSLSLSRSFAERCS